MSPPCSFRQLRLSPDNARAILSTCLRCDERENLVVMDLRLVMEGGDGEKKVDRENLFLR